MFFSWEALTVDARDPRACARWWAETLGWEVAPDGLEVRPPDGRRPSLFFEPAAEGKTTKNRLHLDLRVQDRAAAVELLEARGATRVDIGQGEAAEWIVMRDPEGNEFCLL
ncbi:VOC family protein [Pseudonocardia kongjuensis]|uniref:VOC family protein n=1 Tax=Pseudonocardia kongjuensis TaxID=102227 RepID=A0ABN1XXG7_9PSEU